MKTRKLLITYLLFCIASVSAAGSSGSLPGSSGANPAPLKSAPPPKAEAPKKEASQYKEKPLTKPALPAMTVPFGMPGVVGFENNHWQGTDYLGYLSPNIAVSVEILKSEIDTKTQESAAWEAKASEMLTQADLNPHSEATEGPPLPLLHILLIVYPVDKERYVIFANCRLFEQIQVMRKNFVPAGYWQGITWENEDMTLATADQLDAEISRVLEKVVKSFIDRYKLYNPSAKTDNPAAQKTGNNSSTVPPANSAK